MNRRGFLQAGSAALAATAAGGAYAWQVEPFRLETTSHALPISQLPEPLVGRRLVQLSDLHVGPRVRQGYLADCLQLTAGLRPDILVITGDLITYRGPDQFPQLRELLVGLPHGALGTFAILGNHDYGYGWQMPHVAAGVTAELERAGVTVLRNQAVDVRGLNLVGLDDLWAGQFDPSRVRPALDDQPASLVLVHNPDAADLDGWGRYRGWMLAGHTHGGQCKPPFLPPPILPVANKRYTAGRIPLGDGRNLYINRGLGYTWQVRFDVRPEVTVFTLVRA